MSDQPKGVEKTRVSVTLTRPYLDALDRLVTEGVYLSQGGDHPGCAQGPPQTARDRAFLFGSDRGS